MKTMFKRAGVIAMVLATLMISCGEPRQDEAPVILVYERYMPEKHDATITLEIRRDGAYTVKTTERVDGELRVGPTLAGAMTDGQIDAVEELFTPLKVSKYQEDDAATVEGGAAYRSVRFSVSARPLRVVYGDPITLSPETTDLLWLLDTIMIKRSREGSPVSAQDRALAQSRCWTQP